MKINFKVKTYIHLVLFVLTLQGPVYGQLLKLNLVKDFGAKANNKKFDNYSAFKNAAIACSNNKKNIELTIPFGEYNINTFLYTNKEVNKILFTNCYNLKIIGNNSKIKINGSFHKKADELKNGLGVSFAESISPFVFLGCNNLIVENIKIIGNIKSVTRDINVVENGCFGLYIGDSENNTSSNITLNNVESSEFTTDGFYIRTNGKNIKLLNCTANLNARQGLSIVAGENIEVKNCIFTNTGQFKNYLQHAPSAGIDIEYDIKNFNANITIEENYFFNNLGQQLVCSNASNVSIKKNLFKKNDKFESVYNGVTLCGNGTIFFENNILLGNLQLGTGGFCNNDLEMFFIKNNYIESKLEGIISASYFCNADIRNNILLMNDSSSTTYFPYIQNTKAVFDSNIVVISTKFKRLFEKSTPYISLIQHVKSAQNNNWLLKSNNIATKKEFHVAFDGAKNQQNNSKVRSTKVENKFNQKYIFVSSILKNFNINKLKKL